ncbi:unnamed protein product [Enterobius vermicularis]|uniref:Uncharacterized protein n=1 Tax=Enterobius vermicularis TaxID=51028 RepID=A0A0N4V251_ENTVE|nr:unnamed protein product [Enterobius vermicularis]
MQFVIGASVAVEINGSKISVAAGDSCQKLVVCALENCIGKGVGFPAESKLIDTLLSKANFGCVLGPTCYVHCSECSNCKYAQNQIRNVLLHEELDGSCPKLEACAKTCLEDQATDPFSCIFRHRCLKHCLDGKDCMQCYDVMKRVFTGYCYRNGFIAHYGKKCRKMFDDLASVYAN